MTTGNPQGRGFAGALGLYTAGGLFWAFLPFFVGFKVSSGGLSQAEAGSLGSAYLVGFSLASLSALWWVSRFNWRALAAGAALLVALALLLLARLESYAASLITVLAIGLMMGGFWTVAYRIFAATPNPERSFGTGIVVSYSALALVSYVVGQYTIPAYGLTGSAYLLAAIILLLGCSAMFIPGGDAGGNEQSVSNSYRPPLTIGIALLGILLTGFAFASVWAFAERIGVIAGIETGLISAVIASNLLASAAGSVVASLLGTRYGRKLPLLLGMAAMLAAIAALNWASSFWLYAAGLAGLGFTVGLVLPYQMGKLAALDTRQRFVVLIAAAQGIGSAGGPALGGMAADTGGIGMLLALAGSAVLLGGIAFVLIMRREDEE
ncbi:MAG: MFS transporter [Pseudomonadota bacterium]